MAGVPTCVKYNHLVKDKYKDKDKDKVKDKDKDKDKDKVKDNHPVRSHQVDS